MYNVVTEVVTLDNDASGTGVGEGVGAGVGVGFTISGSLTGEVIVYAAITTEMDATTINVISIANMIVFFLVDDSILFPHLTTIFSTVLIMLPVDGSITIELPGNG